MRKSDVYKWLKRYSEDKIYFTKKAKIRCRQRKIPEKLIRDNLLSPIKMIHVKEEDQPNPNEYKFKLYFKISNVQTLCVRLTLNEKIKIITTYIIINKLQKGMWLKWKK